MSKILLEAFESIGTFYARILAKKAHIRHVDDFLQARVKDANLLEVKKQVQPEISPDRIDKWSQFVDLFQIPKITPRIAELLVNANINSVEELSHRDPVQVLYKLNELNEASYFIILKEFSIAEVEQWVYYAKLMTRDMKFGYDIPLIKFFPRVTIDSAIEFAKYRIWTLEDLEAKLTTIDDLAKRVHMTPKSFRELLILSDFCRIHGVNRRMSNILYDAGISNLDMLQMTPINEILQKIMTHYPNDPFVQKEMNMNALITIQQNAQKVKTILGGTV